MKKRPFLQTNPSQILFGRLEKNRTDDILVGDGKAAKTTA